MSLVARQGEAGDVLMAKREAVMAAATRRSTMDHRV
jgi:N-dimethylarginine dimethylaminohydrolase